MHIFFLERASLSVKNKVRAGRACSVAGILCSSTMLDKDSNRPESFSPATGFVLSSLFLAPNSAFSDAEKESDQSCFIFFLALFSSVSTALLRFACKAVQTPRRSFRITGDRHSYLAVSSPFDCSLWKEYLYSQLLPSYWRAWDVSVSYEVFPPLPELFNSLLGCSLLLVEVLGCRTTLY